jgi:two-component system, sensor histidine kinase LadS
LRKFLLSNLILFCLLQLSVAAISPINISANNKNYTFNHNQIGFFEDKSSIISIQNLLDTNSKINFSAMKSENENCGFSKSSYWLKITCINNTLSSQGYYLNIDYALINDIRFYEIENNKLIDSTCTGENYAHHSRQFNNRFFIFYLDINPNSTKTFYVRICNIGEVTKIPISIQNEKQHRLNGSNFDFIDSIYYGYFLFALLFNLLMFFEFKKKLFILSSCFIICMALFLFISDGFAFQYFWPNFSYISNHSIILFAILSSVFLIMFTNIFLDNSRTIKKISSIFYVCASLTIFWNLIPNPYTSYSFFVANFFVLVTVIFIFIISAIKLYYNKTHFNYLFFISIIFVTTAAIAYILRNYNIIGVSYFTSNGIKIGFSIQITFLTASSIIQFRELFKKSNKFLEDMIQKRTMLISTQNNTLKEQNRKIAIQYKEIKQSMMYAKRLQNAILPNKYKFSSIFKDHLIFYEPKDIISGDFYWIADKKKKTYIVTADCTGHGIPGAFLSMLGISFLNQIITKNTDIQPNEILNKLGILFSETINNHEDTPTRDSMDISICLFDHSTKIMDYSGAYNPIYIIRNGDLIELAVDKISLRKDFTTEIENFTNKKFTLQENDKVFMFTDGYPDQFGGEKNKRYSKRNFKNLLIETSKYHMSEQKEVIIETFKEWKGSCEQVDDILILGFEI